MYDFYHKKMMTSKAVKVVCPTDNLQSQQLLQFYYSSASSLCQVLKNDGKTEFPFCKPTETITTARQIKKKVSSMFQKESNE